MVFPIWAIQCQPRVRKSFLRRELADWVGVGIIPREKKVCCSALSDAAADDDDERLLNEERGWRRETSEIRRSRRPARQKRGEMSLKPVDLPFLEQSKLTFLNKMELNCCTWTNQLMSLIPEWDAKKLTGCQARREDHHHLAFRSFTFTLAATYYQAHLNNLYPKSLNCFSLKSLNYMPFESCLSSRLSRFLVHHKIRDRKAGERGSATFHPLPLSHSSWYGFETLLIQSISQFSKALSTRNGYFRLFHSSDMREPRKRARIEPINVWFADGHSLIKLLITVMVCLVVHLAPSSCAVQDPRLIVYPGDVNIALIVNSHKSSKPGICSDSINLDQLRATMTALWSIHQINANRANNSIRLGLYVYDTCSDVEISERQVVRLLGHLDDVQSTSCSKEHREAPLIGKHGLGPGHDRLLAAWDEQQRSGWIFFWLFESAASSRKLVLELLNP